MRTKDAGQITNKFDDTLYVFFRKDNLNWQLLEYEITTTPGYVPETSNLPDKVPIIAYAQFIDKLKLDTYVKTKPEYVNAEGNLVPSSTEEHKALRFTEAAIYRNDKLDKYNYRAKVETGDFNLWIRRASSTGSVEKVFNYSEDGSQVFKNTNQYNQFITIIEEQAKTNNIFSYAICRKSEFDDFIPDSEQKEKEKEEAKAAARGNKELTGEEELDLILSRINTAQVQKNSSGDRQIVLFYNSQRNYIVFYNNKRFAIFDNPSPGGFVSKTPSASCAVVIVTVPFARSSTSTTKSSWATKYLVAVPDE